MKRLFIAILLMLLAAAGLVAAIENDPGYLLIAYGGYTLETSVWIGALIFLLLAVVVLGGGALLQGLIRRGSRMGFWFSSRRQRVSHRQTTQGMIAFIEGNWSRSRRLLARSAENSDTPLLNYLLAARASHELGDESQTRHFLSSAEGSTSGAGIAVELSQAEMQLQSGQLEECLVTLNRARRNASRHPSVLKLLQQVYVGLREWDSLLEILPELRRHKVLSSAALKTLEVTAFEGLMLQATESRENAHTALQAVWEQVPKALRQDAELVTYYAELLANHGAEPVAERVISSQLRREWSDALIALYGRVRGEDSNKQLLKAEAWLRERNNDATLLLALGRLSLRNELWGKAREYFESSLKLKPSAEAYAELGRLLAHLGEHEQSNHYFHQGLLTSTHGLPALPMPHKHTV